MDERSTLAVDHETVVQLTGTVRSLSLYARRFSWRVELHHPSTCVNL